MTNVTDKRSTVLPREWIKKLFKELALIFGNPWTSQFDSDDVFESHIRLWQEGLSKRSGREVALGLAKCKSKPPGLNGKVWPPNLPEFNSMCDPAPEDAGLPSTREAFLFACGRNWVNPAIYDAAVRVGIFELRNWPEQKSWARFEKSYAETVGKAFRGDPITGAPGREPRLERKTMSKEARKVLAVEALKEIKKGLK